MHARAVSCCTYHLSKRCLIDRDSEKTQCILSSSAHLLADREVFKHSDTFAEEREEDEDMLEQATGAVGATGGAESSKEQ